MTLLLAGCRRCGDETPYLPQKSDRVFETMMGKSEAMVFEEESLSDSSDYYSDVGEGAPEDSRDTSGMPSEEEFLKSLEGVVEELNKAQEYIDNQGYISE
jgi:hypothetical protein